jgi:hypothetical protein
LLSIYSSELTVVVFDETVSRTEFFLAAVMASSLFGAVAHLDPQIALIIFICLILSLIIVESGETSDYLLSRFSPCLFQCSMSSNMKQRLLVTKN